jgi:sortase A
MFHFKKNLPLFFELVILFLSILVVFYTLWNWNALVTLFKFRLKQISYQTNYTQEQLANKSSEPNLPDQIIIPRIGVNSPVIFNSNKEKMLEDLKRGVLRYPESELPGEKGNIVLIGHSSGIPGDAGQYDNVFALLSELKKGDQVTLYFKGNQFNYSIFDKNVIRSDFKDLKLDSSGDSNLILITCWPLGTNFRRLAVLARQNKIL